MYRCLYRQQPTWQKSFFITNRSRSIGIVLFTVTSYVSPASDSILLWKKWVGGGELPPTLTRLELHSTLYHRNTTPFWLNSDSHMYENMYSHMYKHMCNMSFTNTCRYSSLPLHGHFTVYSSHDQSSDTHTQIKQTRTQNHRPVLLQNRK